MTAELRLASSHGETLAPPARVGAARVFRASLVAAAEASLEDARDWMPEGQRCRFGACVALATTRVERQRRRYTLVFFACRAHAREFRS